MSTFKDAKPVDLQTDPKFTFVHADDWVGLYIDGKLFYQSHEIEPESLILLFTKNVEHIDVDDYKWIEVEGQLPQTLDEVHVKNATEKKLCLCCHRQGPKHYHDCIPHALCQGKGCADCYGGRCLKEDFE